MYRKELLGKVNARTSPRYGITISDNMLSDILESKIIKAPEKHGRVRNWTAREYRQLLEIARLKSLGISDHAQIHVMMWLKRRNAFPMIFDQKHRESLGRYIDRNIAMLFRGINSTYPEVKNRRPDGYPARTVLLKMGPLDDCFAGIVEYERHELLGFYELVRNGNSISADIIAGIRDRIIRSIMRTPIESVETRIFPLMKPTVQVIARVFGDVARSPDSQYSAVAQSIMRASPEQLEHAKRLLDLSIKIFRRIGLNKVAVSLLHPKWRLVMLGLNVHLVIVSARISPNLLPSTAELARAEGPLSA